MEGEVGVLVRELKREMDGVGGGKRGAVRVSQVSCWEQVCDRKNEDDGVLDHEGLASRDDPQERAVQGLLELVATEVDVRSLQSPTSIGGAATTSAWPSRWRAKKIRNRCMGFHLALNFLSIPSNMYKDNNKDRKLPLTMYTMGNTESATVRVM